MTLLRALLLAACCVAVIALCLWGSANAAVEQAGSGQDPAGTAHFIACGKANLVHYEATLAPEPRIRPIWRWNPFAYEGLPDDWRKLFRHISECQPVAGGRYILITASTDGIGVVDRANSTFVFIGTATNAHSATFLPGGYVAVAASTGGDELVLFDPDRTNRRLISVPLKGGHGVEWNDAAQMIVALGDEQVKLFRWSPQAPEHLELIETIDLPQAGGHNLSRIPGTDRYEISTRSRTWIFDLEKRRFSNHPQIASAYGVKSMSSLGPDGPLLWVKAEENWWAYSFRFAQDDAQSRAKVESQFYKARWIVPTP